MAEGRRVSLGSILSAPIPNTPFRKLEHPLRISARLGDMGWHGSMLKSRAPLDQAVQVGRIDSVVAKQWCRVAGRPLR